jgi:hypothetical protein
MTIGAFMNATTKFTNVLKFNPDNPVNNNLLTETAKGLSPKHTFNLEKIMKEISVNNKSPVAISNQNN